MPRRKWVYDPEAPDPWGGKGAMVEVDTRKIKAQADEFGSIEGEVVDG